MIYWIIKTVAATTNRIALAVMIPKHCLLHTADSRNSDVEYSSRPPGSLWAES